MASLTHGWAEKGKYTSRGSVKLFWDEEMEEHSGDCSFFLLFSEEFSTFGIILKMFQPCWGCVEALITVQALQCPTSWMDEREVLFCRPHHTRTSCQSPWSCHSRHGCSWSAGCPGANILSVSRTGSLIYPLLLPHLHSCQW